MSQIALVGDEAESPCTFRAWMNGHDLWLKRFFNKKRRRHSPGPRLSRATGPRTL